MVLCHVFPTSLYIHIVPYPSVGRFTVLDILPRRCTSSRELVRAYRKAMLQYHPDKYDGDAACAHRMSLLINAAREVLEPLCTPSSEL